MKELKEKELKERIEKLIFTPRSVDKIVKLMKEREKLLKKSEEVYAMRLDQLRKQVEENEERYERSFSLMNNERNKITEEKKQLQQDLQACRDKLKDYEQLKIQCTKFPKYRAD